MLAFTVFAMLAVGTITVMNQGVASAQEALETTLVRQQIDSQAEALRFIHQAYMANPATTVGTGTKFKTILTDKAVDRDASPFGDPGCLTAIPGDNNPFVVNPRNGNISNSADIDAMGNASNPNVPAYAQLDDSGVHSYGLWVEAVNGGEPNQPKFVDFHIRACWYSVISDAPRTIGTIVRLYYAS
jgi:hypothetical protein